MEKLLTCLHCCKIVVFAPFVLQYVTFGSTVPLPYLRSKWQSTSTCFKLWRSVALLWSSGILWVPLGARGCRVSMPVLWELSVHIYQATDFKISVFSSYCFKPLWLIAEIERDPFFFRQYAYKICFPNMADRYSLNSYMFSPLLLHFHYFLPVTDDNIFVLNMLLKAPDILSSLISLFFPFWLPLSFSYSY